MKIFWGVILVLAVAAGVLMVRRGGTEQPSQGSSVEVADAGAGLAEPLATDPPTRSAADEQEAIDEGVAGLAEADAQSGRDAAEPADVKSADEQPEAAADPEPVDAVADAPQTDPPVGETAPPARRTEPLLPGTPEYEAAMAEARVLAEKAEAARAAAAKAAEEATGPSIRIDDRWTVPGDGTKANPYLVPWDVLVSAGREYNPRQGKTELPAWVTQLDGKHVRLTGFLLFPIVATDADELLVMYNQWDGCCIGIPPTPYDSVEVKLRSAAGKDAWRFTYGAVTGVLRVDPYLAGKWLVSLYVLDEAELEATGL